MGTLKPTSARDLVWEWWPLLLGILLFLYTTPTPAGVAALLVIQAVWLLVPVAARKAGAALGSAIGGE